MRYKMRFTVGALVSATATAGVLWAVAPMSSAQETGPQATPQSTHGAASHVDHQPAASAASSADDGEGGQEGLDHGDMDLSMFKVDASAVMDSVELPPHEGEVSLEELAKTLKAQVPVPAKPNYIGTGEPPAKLVNRCRHSFTAADSCGVALAMADGKLKPGYYSNEELAAAVAAAGYEWHAE